MAQVKAAIILGCGPTGLAAAHACFLAGYKVSIFSRKTKSKLYGAQYLHQAMPELEYPEDPVKISYLLEGSREGYSAKVYGPEWDGAVSPDQYEGQHEAWDIRWSYDELWDRYANFIVDVRNINTLLRDIARFPGLIINTIPKPQLCLEPETHQFLFQTIWAMGDAPGIQSIPFDCPSNTVLCSGRESDEWYRVSNVYGYRTMEWASTRRPILDGKKLPAARVNKPLSTNCDCWSRFLHVGRFGAWKKGVVVHHAYHDVVEAL